jgi:hypothetical protein
VTGAASAAFLRACGDLRAAHGGWLSPGDRAVPDRDSLTGVEQGAGERGTHVPQADDRDVAQEPTTGSSMYDGR